MPGLIYNIQHYSIHDGPGIRTTVFLKGCPLRCWWCHNPESQEAGIEQVEVHRELDGKLFSNQSAVGSWQLAVNVMAEIEKDMVFYRESGGGVTFSGGEPLMQPDFLAEMLELCKSHGIHTAIDTCGHAEPGAFRKVMDSADLFLYDLKLMDDAQHMKYTGVSNLLALKNLEMLANAGKEILIRFPVIPGITDGEENIRQIAILMNRLHLHRIDILPYHSIARDKYRRMNREYLLPEIKEPTGNEMKQLKHFFISNKLIVN
jgi:pyruvate formate lyase activating enzyme